MCPPTHSMQVVIMSTRIAIAYHVEPSADSIIWLCLQVRRPNNYIFSLAETLGPTDPNPTIDLSGLDMIKTVVQDSDNKLFIGGLPCEWPEDQVSLAMALCQVS